MSTALDPIAASFIPPESSTALTAEEMAQLVDVHAAALWRGEETADGPFYRWLGSCLRIGDTAEPAGRPAAISNLAAGGAGIRWFETPTEILGFVPGVRDARYVVSRYACPPWFRSKT